MVRGISIVDCQKLRLVNGIGVSPGAHRKIFYDAEDFRDGVDTQNRIRPVGRRIL